MALSVKEQQVLARIEARLARTEPELAAALRTFAVPAGAPGQPAAERPLQQPAREPLTRQGWRRALSGRVLLGAAAAAAVIATAVTVPGSGSSCPNPGGQQAHAATAASHPRASGGFGCR